MERNKKPSAPQVAQVGKEPAAAFSNVTNSLSECSPNDRPSDFSPTEKSSPVPGGSPNSVDMADMANSLSVNVPKSTKSSSSDVSEESEKSSSNDVSDESAGESQSARSEKDEEEAEQELITKACGIQKQIQVKPTTPGVIYWDPKDRLEQCDPGSGAIKFWKNTVPLTGRRRDGRSWLPHWIIDEGTRSPWPPVEYMPPRTEGQPIMGPIVPSDEYNMMVSEMAEIAIDWKRIQNVSRTDRHWPNQVFAHINDLDRSLTEQANRMVNQAFSLRTGQEPSKEVQFEEQLIKKTKDYMGDVGKKGVAIGQEFEQVAPFFAEIAYMLETVLNVVDGDTFNSPAVKNDIQQLKKQLLNRCNDLKTRLIVLKAKITDYGLFISKYIQESKNETFFGPALAVSDEMEASSHRSAYQCLKQMKEDIESDASKDKTSVFKRWYQQSRLRQLLEFNMECANRAVKETETIDRIKKMKPPPRPISPYQPKQGNVASKMGVGEQMSDSTDTEDSNFDFYSIPERKLRRSTSPSGKQKKEGEDGGKKSPKKSPEFDFYTAPEPKSED